MYQALMGRLRVFFGLRASALGAYAAFVGALVVAIAVAASTLVTRVAQPVSRLLDVGDKELAALTAPVEHTSRVLETDAWADAIKAKWDNQASRANHLGALSPGSGDQTQDGERERGRDQERAGPKSRLYRTMCVRLCDGYFYPISFATSSSRFEHDEQVCARSCSSPTRLYVYRNPGEEQDDMTSRSGQPYAKLPTAYQFRTALKESCQCRPDPWTPEAQARHQQYAADAKASAPRKMGQVAPGKTAGGDQAAGTAAPRRATGSLRGRSAQAADPTPLPTPSAAPTRIEIRPQVALLNATVTLTDVPVVGSAGETAEPRAAAALPAEALEPTVEPKPARAEAPKSRPTTAASRTAKPARLIKVSDAGSTRAQPRLAAGSASPRSSSSSGANWRTLAFNRY